MKYLRVLGAGSAHRAVPGASQQGSGKCGADVVSGARLAVGSEREEIVTAPVRRQVILVDAREHEDARRLVVDVEQAEGNRPAYQLLQRGGVPASSVAVALQFQHHGPEVEIGRASCRERVSIGGGDVG